MFRKDRVRCTYCPASTKVIEDYQAGDMICSGCGLVLGDRVVDVGAEWRTFSNDALLSKSRVGAEEKLLYDGMDLSTMIGQSGCSTVAYTDDGERKYRNKKSLTPAQRSIVLGFREISEMAEKLSSTRPIVECGQVFFKKIQSKQALRGRSNESIAAACLYLAYRKNSVSRTFKEICAVAKATKREIGKCYKVISKLIGEAISQSSVEEYIPRFCAHLALPTLIENRARQMVRRFEDLGILAGRSPATIAALSILIALEPLESMRESTVPSGAEDGCSHLCITKLIKQISEVTGAAESTIRDAYQVVRLNSEKLFANDPSSNTNSVLSNEKQKIS